MCIWSDIRKNSTFTSNFSSVSVQNRIVRVTNEPRQFPDHMSPGNGIDAKITVLAIGTGEQARLFPDDAFLTFGCHILRAADMPTARTLFDTRRPDLVFLPLRLNGASTLVDIKTWLAQMPQSVIVVAANNDEIPEAADAMRLGAFDCLFTPFSQVRLAKTVENAVRRRNEGLTPPAPDAGPAPENQEARAAATAASPPNGSSDEVPFLGESAAMAAVLRGLEAVARSDATVFIQGEHGTGKALLARKIHEASPRRHAPFVEVTCAGLRPDRLEHDLFGTDPPAHPDTHKAQSQTQPHGGTLYLREIANLDPEVQVHLLRFLQRYGISHDHTAPQSGLRVICSTSKDPEIEMEAGRLRRDLFYRLHVIPLTLPPLRARDADVLLIARARLAQLSRREGRAFTGFTPGAEMAMQDHSWPGNIHQLQSVIWNVVLNHDAKQVEHWMLPQELWQDLPDDLPTGPTAHDKGAAITIHGRSLAQIERDVIRAVIQQHGGSIPQAAQALDVAPSTLYRKRDAWLRDDDDES